MRITGRGKYVFRLTVRNASGRDTVRVRVLATRKAKEFEVEVTDEPVVVGSSVVVAADGLAKAEAFTLRLAGKVLASGTADAKGEVHRTLEVPPATPEGLVRLTLTGSNPSRVGEAELTVLRAKKLDVDVRKDSVVKGDRQVVTVEGLLPGEDVVVLYGGERLVAARASAAGTFKHAFKVSGKAGTRIVKVVGAIATRLGEASFVIEKPTPIQPG